MAEGTRSPSAARHGSGDADRLACADRYTDADGLARAHGLARADGLARAHGLARADGHADSCRLAVAQCGAGCNRHGHSLTYRDPEAAPNANTDALPDADLDAEAHTDTGANPALSGDRVRGRSAA